MTSASTPVSTRREPELVGQTVVVIGGSAGIGLETARRARAEGADVILTGRNPDRLEQAASEVGAQCTAAFDANDAAALAKFFGELPTPIDHVMVTAGGPQYGPLLEMDSAQVREVLSDHVVLGLEVARNAKDKMRAGGTLLLMGGTGGRRIGHGLGIVPAATAALPPFTAALALELAPVRVNLIAAGFVDTPLSASLLGDRLEDRRNELAGDAADRPRRGPRGRCRARRPHHEQHGTHRRDLRHRRWAAVRLMTNTHPSADDSRTRGGKRLARAESFGLQAI
jgi:NAD(P)-dependent dehydrogenase (short-subunit alcohol dehydrogenase family)